jgi:DNA-binding SARP family transcriptional activator
VDAGLGRSTVADRFIDGVASLLAGDFEAAGTKLQSVIDSWDCDRMLDLSARLGIVLSELARGRCDSPIKRLEEVSLAAEIAGVPWISRMAHGIRACVIAGTAEPTALHDVQADVVAASDRDGDEWGAALLQLGAGLSHGYAGIGDAGDLLADARARFDRLGAPVLSVWTEVIGLHPDIMSVRSEMLTNQDVVRAYGIAEAACRQVRATGLLSFLRAARNPRGPVEPDRDSADDMSRLVALMTRSATTTGPVQQAGRPSKPTSVRLRCLGGMHLEVGGQPVDLFVLRPRARAALRMLAVHYGRELHRERLIDGLWPRADIAAGTHRLQVAISSVRQVFEEHGVSGSEAVRRIGDCYRLEIPGAELDVERFLALAREAETAHARRDDVAAIQARRAALDQYGGDLLPEEGPAEYVVADRERLRMTAVKLSLDLAHDLATAGALQDAAAEARRTLHLDRYCDAAWRLLAETLDQIGDQSAATHVRLEHEQISAELSR